MRKQIIRTLSRGQSFHDSLQNTFFNTTKYKSGIFLLFNYIF